MSGAGGARATCDSESQVKSVVELDIETPLPRVAALFGNPGNSTKWMHDIDRYEPLSGQPGTPGSKYRLVPKKGSMVFVATVLPGASPNEFRLELSASNVTVSIAATLTALPNGWTHLMSTEVFSFTSLIQRIFGVLATPAIRKAHRRHMEAFKQFAEER